VYLPWVAMGYNFSTQAAHGGGLFLPTVAREGSGGIGDSACSRSLDNNTRLRALVQERAKLFRRWMPIAMGNLQIAQHNPTLPGTLTPGVGGSVW
jgi:hypothetical protein